MIVVNKASAIPSEKISVPSDNPLAGMVEKTCTNPVAVPNSPIKGAAATTTSSKNKPFSSAATSSLEYASKASWDGFS